MKSFKIDELSSFFERERQHFRQVKTANLSESLQLKAELEIHYYAYMKHSLKTALAVAILSFTQLSQASDHWHNCSDSTGDIKIENEQLQLAGQDAGTIAFKILGRTILKKNQETCVLKGSGQKVVSYYNEDSVERIEIRSGHSKSVAYVICATGGSGLPANDSCK